jgi:4'-phosphopantetheinyl transferase
MLWMVYGVFSIKRWERSPLRPILKFGQAHVWRVDLSEMVPQLESLLPVLTEEERQRGERLVSVSLRQRFFISHAILRLILSAYLEESPREIQFKKAAHGKPSLDGCSLQFNMTHSKDVALYVMTSNTEVGIDVEYLKRMYDMDALVKRFFSQRENEEYRTFIEAERHLAFYRAWTRKEAYLKATGQGLSYPLNHFDVSFAEDGMRCLLRVNDCDEEASAWTVFSFEPFQDYLASIALKAPLDELITYDFNS